MSSIVQLSLIQNRAIRFDIGLGLMELKWTAYCVFVIVILDTSFFDMVCLSLQAAVYC